MGSFGSRIHGAFINKSWEMSGVPFCRAWACGNARIDFSHDGQGEWPRWQLERICYRDSHSDYML